MNKIKFLFLFLFFAKLIHAQSTDTSQFKQFSYLIFGFYDVHDSSGFKTFKNVQGTCFFTKYHNRIYLISARHTLTSWDDETAKKKLSFPDTLKVRLEDKYGNTSYYDLDIRETNNAVKGNFFYVDPDVFVMELKNASFYKINTIDKFLHVSKEKITSIITYGYPAFSLTPSTLKMFIEQAATLTIGKVINKTELNADDESDKTTYLVERNDDLIKQGCSGSAVFYKSSINNKWLFGGVFVKSGIDNRYAEIVKPNYVFDILTRLNKKTAATKHIAAGKADPTQLQQL